MKRSTKLSSITPLSKILVAILFVFLLILSLLVGLKYLKVNDQKLYKSSNLGITFQYPNNLFVNADSDSIILQNFDSKTTQVKYSPNEDMTKKYKEKYQITIKKLDINVKTVDELKQWLSETDIQNSKAATGFSVTPKIIKEEVLTKNNYQGYKREAIYTYMPGTHGISTYILDEKGKVIIYTLDLDTSYGKLYADQILTTFSFIN